MVGEVGDYDAWRSMCNGSWEGVTLDGLKECEPQRPNVRLAMSGRQLLDLLVSWSYTPIRIATGTILQSAFSTVLRASVLAQADAECKL